jgi:transcriptional regulator of acetoin/glycerol metabolism
MRGDFEFTHIEEIQKVLDDQVENYRDDIILDSWKRCVNMHSLDPLVLKEAYILPHEKLREHQDHIDELMQTARFGLETLYKEIVGQNYVVLLTDSTGVTVDYIGDPYKDDELKKAGLYLGSEWSEERAGTCGVGSCIYTGEPITVHQTDHFDASHITLTCTSAPIYNPVGDLTAVLDVSALHSPEIKQSQSFAQHLVRLWALRIEMAFLVNHSRSEWIITFGKSSAFCEIAPEYAVAVNDDGRINGLTRNTMILFKEMKNLELNQEIIGSKITDYFEVKIEEIPILTRNASLHKRHVRMSSGEAFFVTVISAKKNEKNNIQNTFSKAYGVLHGGDPKLENIAKQLEKISQTEVNILLQGETGTGKEYMAKHIHSLRSMPGPFVAINCAAIPENLIESELFGYEKGSFTGAKSNGKIGLIEQANGGTLFLDEIGDMPLNLQARLLRVLSEKEITRVGSTKPSRVDIRVICASHHNLKKLVETADFREDLYYRIAGVTFCLPPLKERQDLDWLINKFLSSKKYGSEPWQLDSAARTALLQYDWPGNVRQLANVIELAQILGEGSISLMDLPEEIRFYSSENKSSQPMLKDILEELDWNITAVASYLGCDRKTVYRRIKKAGIEIQREIVN